MKLTKNLKIKSALIVFSLLCIVYSSIAQSLSDGLQLYYNFKEIIADTAIKDLAGSNNGVLRNGATIGADANHNYLDLPDVLVTARPYLEIGANAGNIISQLEDFSIAFFMWVPTGFKSDFTWEFSNSYNMANDANGHMFFDCMYQKTAITPTNFAGEPDNKLEIGTSVSTDVWSHIVFTLEDSLGRYYVNGVKLDSAKFGTLPKDLGVTEYNWIGRCGYDGGGELAGQYNVNPAKIADFRLYNRALNKAEVTALSNGAGEITTVNEKEITNIAAVYPNPFRNSTSIYYKLTKSEYVTLVIYTIEGRNINTLVNEMQGAGDYNISWTPKDLVQGIYLYKISIGANVQTGMIINK